MGEIADMMLDGTMDPETGEFNFDGEDGPGFPMTGAEAAAYRGATGSPATRYTLSKAWRGKLEKFGQVTANDAYHWQVRDGKRVLADWWPHNGKWRIDGTMDCGDEAAFRDALAKAASAQPEPAPQRAQRAPAVREAPIPNPFKRDADAEVSDDVEAWARALCTAYGADPEELIGMPQHPRWRSFVGYAETAITAAAALGYGVPK